MNEETATRISDIYYNKKTGYTGFEKLYERVKEQQIKITRKDLKKWYDAQELTQTNRKKKETTHQIITAPPYSYQIDTIFIRRHIYLIIIEITSRMLFLHPLPKNNMQNILTFMNNFIKENRVNRLEGDLQFNTSQFTTFCAENDIEYDFKSAKDDHISKGNRLGIVDRATRTIKSYVRKSKATSNQDIQEIVENYNDTVHSTISDKPKNMFSNHARMIDIHAELQKFNDSYVLKYKIGDIVRVKNSKTVFEKEKDIFSKETFKIIEIVNKKYKLEGKQRLYKENELLKVDEVQARPKVIKPKKETKPIITTETKEIREKRTIKKPVRMDL